MKNRPLSQVNAKKVPKVIIWLGLTSLLIDLSTEMIASFLPVFLFTVLMLSPLQVGFVDGLYHGLSLFARVLAAYFADQSWGNKKVALTGYGLTAFARILMLFALPFGALFAFVSIMCDRIGKSIRTAPRDALIAAHAEPGQLATAFGAHRSLDAVGAFLGPLVALTVLWLQPEGYFYLFALSTLVALIGVLGFWQQVPDAPQIHAVQATKPSNQLISKLRYLSHVPQFLMLCMIAAALSLFTISEGLIFVSLQKSQQLESFSVPFMHVTMALVFLLTAWPIGRVADRIGVFPTLFIGYIALVCAYGLFILVGKEANFVTLGGIIFCLGLHYAATDGLLAITIVKALAPEHQTTALALMSTGIALARLLGSTGYGLLWQWYGQAQAAKIFTLGLMLVILVSAFILTQSQTSKQS